jgi:hypothetical protein
MRHPPWSTLLFYAALAVLMLIAVVLWYLGLTEEMKR